MSNLNRESVVLPQLHRCIVGIGEELAVEGTPPARPEQLTAVYLHGLGSNRSGEKALAFEREFARRGLGFLRFDSRGHGDSSGRREDLTLTRQIEDLDHVLAYLARGGPGWSAASVVLIGASLGGWTAAWRSARRPQGIAAQILIAPAFRMLERFVNRLSPEQRARWQREGTWRFQGPWFDFDLGYAAVRDATNYSEDELPRATRVPTLILHGTADETVPCEESRAFTRARHEASAQGIAELRCIEGGDHRLTQQKDVLVAETLVFLERHLAGELFRGVAR